MKRSGQPGNEKDGKPGRRKNHKIKEDDEPPLRFRVREILEGKFLNAIMLITTIFALFGDDFRQWLFNKDADVFFYAGLSLSLVLFTLEILVNSCAVDDFKYGFFFWLDIVGTLSLIIDIQWIINFY